MFATRAFAPVVRRAAPRTIRVSTSEAERSEASRSRVKVQEARPSGRKQTSSDFSVPDADARPEAEHRGTSQHLVDGQLDC